MGDFNLHVDWSNQFGQDSLEEEFFECLHDSFLEQYAMELTREQAILDLVLCNETGIINDFIIRDPLGRSDHSMVEFRIQMESEKDVNDMPVIDDKETKVGEDLETIIIRKEVMLGKLMELKVDKSPSPDGMYPRVLEEKAGEIANVLA
eukprot:g40864.t1